MDLQIDYMAVEDLIPFANNARTHSDEQVAEIAASIREFGFTNPVLIDGDKGIIAGHGRLLAARKLAMESVPCVQLAHLSETQKRAYILADNRLAEKAGWDFDLVSLELESLLADDFDIELTGFDEAYLSGYVEPAFSGDIPDGSYKEQYGIIVTCDDEAEQEVKYHALLALGYDCRVVAT